MFFKGFFQVQPRERINVHNPAAGSLRGQTLVRLDPSMTAERFHFSTILPKSAIKLTSFHVM